MASASGARTAAILGTGQLTDNLNNNILPNLQQGYTGAQSELNTGYGLSTDWLTKGLGVYDQMRAAGSGGLARYEALAGGEGARGQLDALYASPDFIAATEQGNLGLNRRRAAAGMLNSGNADADAIALNQSLATQYLGNARQAQLPLLNLYSQGAQGAAGSYGALAGNATNHYGSLAGLTNDYYTSRANAYDDVTKNSIGLQSQAFAAGDQAKSQNDANKMAAAKIAGSLVLGAMTGGAGLGLMGAAGAAGAAGGAAGAAGGGGGLLGGFSKIFGG